jgi:CspA family cold shock protein
LRRCRKCIARRALHKKSGGLWQKGIDFQAIQLPLPRLSRQIFFIISIFFRMNTGTVKFFNETKGFGFIVNSSTSEEVFVHASGLVDKIREGDTVTYETKQGKKGINAVNVQLA